MRPLGIQFMGHKGGAVFINLVHCQSFVRTQQVIKQGTEDERKSVSFFRENTELQKMCQELSSINSCMNLNIY